MSNKVVSIIAGFGNLVLDKNPELVKKRLAICRECPIRHKNWCIKKRGGCGCYLPAKSSYADEECPKGKW